MQEQQLPHPYIYIEYLLNIVYTEIYSEHDERHNTPGWHILTSIYLFVKGCLGSFTKIHLRHLIKGLETVAALFVGRE